MPKPSTKYDEMAQAAAQRIDRARELGQQMTFLPDEGGSGPVATVDRDPDKPTRGKGKALSQMREWLAHRGYELPEEQLAQMAGLASSEPVMLQAMRNAEQVVTWAFDGAVRTRKDGTTFTAKPSPEQRLQVFSQLYTTMLRAAEALLPYGLAKAGGDEGERGTIVQVVVPQGPSRSAEGRQMRDVTPRTSVRMVPADVRHEMQRNQDVSETESGDPDGETRTDGVKR